MTVEEIKTVLTKKCKESWEIYKCYRRVFGMDSLPAQKMQTAWVNYDSLYKEFFGEEVKY